MINVKLLRLDRGKLTVAASSVTNSDQGSEDSRCFVLRKVSERKEDGQICIKYLLT